jgi:8-oxo-dGTP diphosphatase
VARREYPECPRVGVGGIVLHDGHVLLVRRGQPPVAGKWSVPGGMVELGETTAEAVVREIAEECGLRVRLAGVAGVLDRVIRDPDGRVRYHWVLVDYVAFPESGVLAAGSDAAEARWVRVDDVEKLDVTEGLVEMIRRAVALSEGRLP